MASLRIFALSLGLFAPAAWWLGSIAAVYASEAIYLIIHNAGFPGYMYYIRGFTFYAKAVIFGLLVILALRSWFSGIRKSAFALIIFGYVAGALLLALTVPRFGVQARLNWFFGESWIVFFVVAFAGLLPSYVKGNDEAQPVSPQDAPQASRPSTH